MDKIKFRCDNCRKLLGEVEGDANIVCPRCGGLNKLNAQTGRVVYISRKMRERKTSSGMRF